MGRVSAQTDVPGTVEDAEELWYDVRRWPTFVDGFGHVHSCDDGWPGEGTTLVWDSLPNGRGRVVERVGAQSRGEGQTVEVEDPRLRGTQRIAFTSLDDGVEVTLALDYQLKQGGVLRPVLDGLFIRRAVRDSLRRTLDRFGRELEEERRLR
jgi:polyketide cyclase/dehydrase/lipid transport protein